MYPPGLTIPQRPSVIPCVSNRLACNGGSRRLSLSVAVRTGLRAAASQAAAGQEAAVGAMASLLQERDLLLAEVAQLRASNAYLRVRARFIIIHNQAQEFRQTLKFWDNAAQGHFCSPHCGFTSTSYWAVDMSGRLRTPRTTLHKGI